MRRKAYFKITAVFVALFSISILLAACGDGADLTVASLEITQGIQTTTNTVQLVSQRSTAVRATLDILTGTAPVANVTGKLHVFVDGVEITPAAGVSAINEPFSAPAAPQRANEDDTLNFELIAPTGITVSANVDFRVDISVPGDPDTSNNTGEVNNLTVVDRTTPTLYFTRINYTPAGLGLPDLADVEPGVGDAFVRRIFPVNDGDPNLYREGLFPTLSFSEDDNGDGILDSAPEGNNLLSFLASCRQLIVDLGLGANDNTFLYAWIRDNPISGNGLGQVLGFNAYGNTEHIRHQRTYAHELGHNFGNPAGHNTRPLDEVGWDVGGRLDDNPATNNTTGRVKPTTLVDINFGGKLTEAAWVDTITYGLFSSSAILANAGPDALPASGLLAAMASQQERRFSERVVVLQGIFDLKGRELLYLEPVFRFPWLSQPSSLEQTGLFTAEVTDESGIVTTVSFDALVGDDSGGPDEKHIGFFEVMVPVSPQLEVVSVRITDARGERVFGGFFETSKPPEIIIVGPEEKAELGKETKIAWEVRDPDTSKSDLMYQIAYSPDGGQSWVPVAVDVPGTESSVVFNSTQIQESRGRGVLRVFVSDGLNTAFADVSGLTTLAAEYPAP